MNDLLKGILNDSREKFRNELTTTKKYFSKPSALIAVTDKLISFCSSVLIDVSRTLVSRGKITSQSELSSYIESNDLFSFVSNKSKTVMDESTEKYVATSCQFLPQYDDVIMLVAGINVNTNDTQFESAVYDGALCSLAFVCAECVKIFSTFEHPPLYRIGYVNTIISVTTNILERSQGEFSFITNSFSELNSLISSCVASSYTYLENRKTEQERSVRDLNDVMAKIACDVSIGLPIDPITVTSGIDELSLDQISCVREEEIPVATSRIIGDPTISCSSDQLPSENNEEATDLEYPIDAIVKFYDVTQISPGLKMGDAVGPEVVLGTVDSFPVHSPVFGLVKDIRNNEIYITNASLANESNAVHLSKKLVDNFAEIGDLEDMIKNFFVKLTCPIRLSNPGHRLPAGVMREHLAGVKSYEKYLADHHDDVRRLAEIDSKTSVGEDNLLIFYDRVKATLSSFIDSIKILVFNAYNSPLNVKSVPSDHIMFPYYVSILAEINSSLSLTKTLNKLRDGIKIIAKRRLYTESSSEDSVRALINDRFNSMSSNKSTDHFIAMNRVYAVRNSLSDVYDYVESSIRSFSLSESDRTRESRYIMTIFEVWSSRMEYARNQTGKANLNDLLRLEYSYIDSFIRSSFDRLHALRGENEEITKNVEKLSSIPASHVISRVNETLYYVFDLRKKSSCELEHDDLNPDTREDMRSKRYWIRYFSIISALSIASVDSWSTGLILPSGPVLLPVIYVPIVPITTPFGSMVIGTGVCGASVSPFVYRVNGSPYHVSFGSETNSLRDEILSLKRNLRESLKTIKESVAVPLLHSIAGDIEEAKREMKGYDSELTNARETGSSDTNTIDDITAKRKEANDRMSDLKRSHKSVYEYVNANKYPDKNDVRTAEIRTSILAQKKIKYKIDDLTDKMELILKNSPGSIPPNSTSFGPSIKKPDLTNLIDEDITDSMDRVALDTSADTFAKRNDLMTNKRFFPDKSLLEYRDNLKTSMKSIITKEPFPTYTKLTSNNIAFLSYSRKLIKTGSKIFGIPGQPPM